MDASDGNGSAQHEWAVTLDNQMIDNTSDPLAILEREWKEILGCHVIVRGYPTLARPIPCGGLEVPTKTLFDLVKKPHLTTHRGTLLLYGNGSVLAGEKKARKLLTWAILKSSKPCTCRSKLRVDFTSASLQEISLDTLWDYRHIIGYCECHDNAPDDPGVDEDQAEGIQHGAMKSVPGAIATLHNFPQSTRYSPNPSIRTNSTATQLDSDLFSISDSSESNILESSPLDPNQPSFMIVDRLARCLMVEYQECSSQIVVKEDGFDRFLEAADNETSEASQGGRGNYQREVGRQTNRSRASQKRPRDSDREEGDKQDEDRGSDVRNPRSAAIQHLKLLACPFWKADPAKHKACFGKKLYAINRLKQHLYRTHTPLTYCDRCMVIFSVEDAYEEHKRVPCVLQGPKTLDGITRKQADLLSKKSKAGLSIVEQWCNIWKIIFPQRPLPISPYQDADLSEDFCRFREFAQERGATLLVQELRTQGLPEFGSDSDFNLETIVTQSVHMWLEEWITRLRLPSQSQDCADQRSEEGTQNEASSSSIGDSGVSVGHRGAYSQPSTIFIQNNHLTGSNNRRDPESTHENIPDGPVATGDPSTRIRWPSTAPLEESSLFSGDGIQLKLTNDLNVPLDNGPSFQFNQTLTCDGLSDFWLNLHPEQESIFDNVMNETIEEIPNDLEWSHVNGFSDGAPDADLPDMA
jgi:hypothetical protein